MRAAAPVLTALGLIIVQTGCSRAEARFEQTAFDQFISEYWGPELFADKCAGLSFDPAVPLVVLPQAPGFEINLLDVAAVAPIDVRAAAQEEGGLERLARSGSREGFADPIDLSAYPFARPSDSGKPKKEWQPSDGYLLRFSNRVRFQDRVYVQIWVKGPRFSSGARIVYEFDEGGQLLRSRKHSLCDDWG